MATPSNPFNLNRFTTHQMSNYPRALTEIQRGKKVTHWIWYIFPILPGISTSNNGRRFAISSLEEARAYLAHPLLGNRLVEISQAVLDSNVKTAVQLVGDVDANKLQACMTLFLRADRNNKWDGWQKVLDKYFEGTTHRASEDILDGEDEDEEDGDGIGDVMNNGLGGSVVQAGPSGDTSMTGIDDNTTEVDERGSTNEQGGGGDPPEPEAVSKTDRTGDQGIKIYSMGG